MKTPISLPACVVACMTVASCRSADREKTDIGLKSEAFEEQTSGNAGPCSPQQIIEIADAEARRRGYRLEEWRMIYDEGNADWNSLLAEVEARRLEINALRTKHNLDIKPQPPFRVPELEGRDYQVIIYTRREIMTSGDLMIFIDRNSGEVLQVIHGG